MILKNHNSGASDLRRFWFFFVSRLLTCAILIITPCQVRANQFDSPEPSGVTDTPQFILEDIEIIGSQRINTRRLAEELGFVIGRALASDTISDAQMTLLGMGLFRSAILSLRKGGQPGWVVLVVELQDDQTIIGRWGLGSTLSLNYGELRGANFDQDSSPFATRLQLVGRNLFSQMHRAYTLFDIDGRGKLREFEFAYGLPRFSREKIQFDAKLTLVDAKDRYLNGIGFGVRAESQWRYDITSLSSVAYGLAMYLNRPGRYSYQNMPESIVGPQFGYRWESRLLSFLPRPGYLFESNILLAPGQDTGAVLELQTAGTWSLADLAYLTVDIKALKAGVAKFLSRTEGSIDIPISDSRHDQAALFIASRYGYDRIDELNRFGSDLSVGIRYHSAGFIAELSFRYTDSPKSFEQLVDSGRSGL